MNYNGLSEEIKSVLKDVSKIINIDFLYENESIEFSVLEENDVNDIEIMYGRENYIKYKNRNHLFRALSLYAQFIKEGKENFELNEKALIQSVGTMIDVSRNAVYKVEEIKKLLLKVALMGHSRFMLYTEDTYEIDGYEYFGYLRGKYTKAELKEIDDYAYLLGIEVIPCIQTLAHLKQTLKYEYAKDFRDTADVLLVGEEKTYKFIEAMISTLRGVFRSNNIHIGMDEAFDLGRGESINKNGYKSHHELMIEHLNIVNEICKKYNFKPMMWDDMFFRAGAPNGNYYDLDTVITEEITSNIPKEVSLVYWDYYNSDEEVYEKLLKIREGFNNDIVFAGGSWRWLGYAPTYSKTFSTTNAALKICKAKKINEVLVTLWGDDGSEAPLNVSLLGLMLFAEHSYYEEVDDDWLNRRCEFLTGLSMEDFFALEKLDLVPTVKYPNLKEANPSKYLTYQDILLGAFDKHIEGLELNSHYNKLAKEYEKISEKTEEYKEMYLTFSKLSSFLELKSEIGINLRKAYLNKDKAELKNIQAYILKELIRRLDDFHNSYRKLWYRECKGQGFEVIDIRLGGIKARLDSTSYRLEEYLTGNIHSIEELEEKILYFLNNFSEDCKLISYIRYKDIVTQNTLTW